MSLEDFFAKACSEKGNVLVKTPAGQTFKLKAENVVQASASLACSVTVGANFALTFGVSASFNSPVFLDIKFSAYYTFAYLSHLSVYGSKFLIKKSGLKNSVAGVNAGISRITKSTSTVDIGQIVQTSAVQFKKNARKQVSSASQELAAFGDSLKEDVQNFSRQSKSVSDIETSLSSTVASMNKVAKSLKAQIAECKRQVQVLTENAAERKETGGKKNIQGGVVPVV